MTSFEFVYLYDQIEQGENIVRKEVWGEQNDDIITHLKSLHKLKQKERSKQISEVKS